MEGQSHSLIIALTFKSSLGAAKTSSFVDRNVNLKKTIRTTTRTSLSRSTVNSQNALNTLRRCGKSDRVIKRENGSIGVQAVTPITVVPDEFTFMSLTTRTNVSMLVKNSISEFSRTIGFTMEPSFVHRAKSSAENSSP